MVRTWERAFSIVSVPLAIDGAKSQKRPLIVNVPLIFLTIDGQPYFPQVLNKYLVNGAHRGFSLTTLARDARSLGRLHEFQVNATPGAIADRASAMRVLSRFAAFRTLPHSEEDLADICPWERASPEVAKMELHAIEKFARYQKVHHPNDRLLFDGIVDASLAGPPSPYGYRPDRLLAHLDIVDRLNDENVLNSRAGRHFGTHLTAKRKQGGRLRGTTSLNAGQIDAIIENEKNLTFRALWILLAFGGVRLSEGLTLFVQDVLPGRMSSTFGDVEMGGLPFVILAHPTLCTYNGDTADFSEKRIDYLYRAYKLSPRLHQKKKQRAGHKGFLYFSPLVLSWVYWINNSRAMEFAALVQTILLKRSSFGVTERHPYLYVNSVDGEPLSSGACEKAFARAIKRIGISPSLPGASIHGLRHFYKWYADKKLKMSRSDQQIMMRYVREDSLDDYGRRASECNATLKSAMARLANG